MRGDVRFGGHNVDGNFGVLAFNYFPSNGGNAGFDGDMVIDTNDRFYATRPIPQRREPRPGERAHARSWTRNRTRSHRTVDQTKLMEPFISFAYLGAQHDDILGAQYLYGDDRERNNSRATPTDLGNLTTAPWSFKMFRSMPTLLITTGSSSLFPLLATDPERYPDRPGLYGW